MTKPSLRESVVGLALGALGGFLLWQVGALDAAGIAYTQSLAVLVLAVVGAILGALGWNLGIVVADAIGLGVFFLVAFTPIIDAPAEHLVRDDPLPASTGAVIVLSSSIGSNSALDEFGTDRILTGLELMKTGVAPRMIATSVRRKVNGRELSSDLDQLRFAKLAGVDSIAIITPVRSTHDEAIHSGALLLPKTKDVIVVTSPLHTRRACATFEKVGFTVHCVAAREHEKVTRRPVTASDRLAAFRFWLYEMAATVEYDRRGWI